MKNFHPLLPERTWSGLRAEQTKKARHDRIADWAAEMAGTDLDLDPDLEAAGIKGLVKAGKSSLDLD